MEVTSTLHLNKLNLLLLLLLLPHHGAPAASPLQPAASPSTTVWDITSICVIIGAIIITFLIVAAFSMFLHRYAQSHRNGQWPYCPNYPGGGVRPEILQTFPTFVYSSVTGHLKHPEPLQCAICISDFNSDDTLRLLPQCNHVFHPSCIDAWLSTHPTCPVCRANLNCSCHGSPDFAIWVADKETDAAPRRESPPRCEICDEEGKGGLKRASKSKLARSNSTGHSLVEEGSCLERYTLRVPEDVKKSIMVNHGEIMLQRSASYNGRSMKGFCWSDSEGSSKGIRRNSIGFEGSAAAVKSPK